MSEVSVYHRFFAQHKRLGGKLYRHLRQGHKRYHRGRKEKAAAIKNANGLLRQYVKKGTDLTKVTDSDNEFAVSRIKYRPKKCLDFKQPTIVYKEMTLAA